MIGAEVYFKKTAPQKIQRKLITIVDQEVFKLPRIG